MPFIVQNSINKLKMDFQYVDNTKQYIIIWYFSYRKTVYIVNVWFIFVQYILNLLFLYGQVYDPFY